MFYNRFRKKLMVFTIFVTILFQSNPVLAGQSLDFRQINGKMQLIQEIIDEYYLFDEDMKQIEEGIYTGMLYGLGDIYSSYYTAEQYQQMVESTQGEYYGIGVELSQDRTTGVITIKKVFDNAPSYEAGVRAGDILYKVEGQEVTGIDLNTIVGDGIKGKEGTFLSVTVYRPADDQYYDFSIERKQIEIPTIEAKMLDNQIGYIQVSEFDVVTAGQFKQAVDNLQAQGMKKMLIDLRNNPGGVLAGVIEMLAYLLPDGTLVYTANKDGYGTSYGSRDGYLISEMSPAGISDKVTKIAEDSHELKIPLVVLVNGDSASASEVFAGAIKDYNWGTIVGTTTFGKGIVQSLIPFDDGTAIKLTIAHYYTPKGFDLHGKGIEPDVFVDLEESLKTKALITMEEDNQLQEALKVLAAQ